MSSERKLLAVSHTYQHTGPIHVRVRIISAREATKRERLQYESEPRLNDSDEVSTIIELIELAR